MQFRYKKRVYKQSNLDEKQLAKLHTKVGGQGWHSHAGPVSHTWRYRLCRSGQFLGQRLPVLGSTCHVHVVEGWGQDVQVHWLPRGQGCLVKPVGARAGEREDTSRAGL